MDAPPRCAHCGEPLHESDDWSSLLAPGADERVLVRLHDGCYVAFVMARGEPGGDVHMYEEEPGGPLTGPER